MTPVGTVYECTNGSYLFVTRVPGEHNTIWIGRGASIYEAVAEQPLCLGREEAMALVDALNKAIRGY
jgi:hypothetical protein